ncbi:hypothetical protein UFOVP534_46 [uncultured Caudovirales phage]|uniref:Uncharacterized protein n=1 Tax=uncultured Caudovirales phage TaxID=2100421 RepID=A0A6J5MPL7_9CAUD|nr:hypothetical protein UFOVP534_46 [uncultured Caudovirales phage]
MALGAVVARIVSQYSDKGSKAAQRDIAKLGKNFDAFSKKATKAFGLASGAAVAFAAKIGKDAVQAAIEDQKSQVLLANSLRNTVGATDDAIASVEDYITKQQALFSVADDKLRPSLAALAAATGSVTEAQRLQGVALDIAADKQIDLVTASKLVAKAYGGNVGALKKLYPEISAVTVKSKDFAGALDVVARISGGAAAASADTLAGRLEGLKLAYGEVLETLGYALLPIVTEFVAYIQGSVLPALESWTSANKDKIANSLKQIFEVLKVVIKQLGEFFGFISRNIGTLKVFGAILAGIFVGSKIAAGIQAVVAAIGLVTTALTAQTAAASTAAIATGFATAGVSLTLGAAAAVYFYKEMGKVQKSVEGATTAINEQTTAIGNYSMSANRVYESTEKVVVKLTKTEIAAANAAKKSAAEAAAAAKKKADSLKAIAALTKAGATATSETDPIQLEAARLNLVKQGAIAEQARFAAFVAARKFEIDANNAAAESAKRYNDILMALADAKITPAEFELLAAKWGITTNAAQLYVQTIVSIRDNNVSAADVAALAETWGVTYQQASKYLDFFTVLNDGTLSDAEIGKLQEKWGLTEKQVLQYAATFQAADDGKIDLTEVTNLGNQWGLTKKETEAYIAKILEEFGYDPSLLAAPVTAEGAWVAAYGSVESYKEISEGTFTYDPSITDGSDAAAIGWYAAAGALASYAAAAAGIGAQSTVINPPSGGGNTGGFGFSLPEYVKNQIPVEFLAAGGIVTSPTLSMIGEAGPEAVIPLSQMGSMGGQNITVNVGGSIISESDLVATIRNELLALQQSGSTITRTNLSL